MNIQDVADATGVSIATVSRVINRSGYVSSATRERVEEYIRRNNYSPNAIARSLSRQDSASIGIVIPDVENPFFSSVIHGITEVAEQNGYNLFFFGTNEKPEAEHSALRTLQSQRVRGVVITPVSEYDRVTGEMVQELRQSGIPVVLVDRDLQSAAFDGVFVDNIQGAFDAVVCLRENGHERIALIGAPNTSKPGKDRMAGYVRAMEHLKLPLREEYIVRGDFRVDMGYALAKKLLSLPQPPTAIFTCNNLMTLGCLKYLTEQKYKLGKNISLIGFDDIDILRHVGYKLSVVDRATTEMGRAAIKMLLENIGSPPGQETKRVVFPTKLILRGSEKYRWDSRA